MGTRHWPKRLLYKLFTAAIIGIMLAITAAHSTRSASPLTIEGDRWLAITDLRGSVTFAPVDGEVRQAQIGDRLDEAGDRLTTGSNASVRLAADQAAGSISIAENSQIRIIALSLTSSGGRITTINVLRGQIRMRVRSLTNPDSRLEIQTPAGISGVRGTDFGVTVQSGGRTGVATAEGSVYVRAQGESVSVSANLQTAIIPGEPPEPPEPLRDDPTVFIRELSEVPGSAADHPMARLIGTTDPVNLVQINREPKALSRAGRFDVVVAMDADRRIQMSVLTPLGTHQPYAFIVP